MAMPGHSPQGASTPPPPPPWGARAKGMAEAVTRRLGTHWRSDCTPCWHASSCAKCAPHSTRNLPRGPRTCSARDRPGRGPGAQHSPARAGLLCQSRERANGGPSSASMPRRQARESARDLAEHVPGTWALEAGCRPARVRIRLCHLAQRQPADRAARLHKRTVPIRRGAAGPPSRRPAEAEPIER